MLKMSNWEIKSDDFINKELLNKDGLDCTVILVLAVTSVKQPTCIKQLLEGLTHTTFSSLFNLY